MAYLGFPAPRGKTSLGAPTQPVCGSTDVKSEMGVKGRRKLSRAPHIIVSRPVQKFRMTDVTELTSGPLNLGNR